MQHTIAAVFDNRESAQQAMDDLLASGFPRQDVRLTEKDQAAASPSPAAGETQDHGFSFSHFFTHLFGGDDERQAQTYSDAVSRGHYVLTLAAADEAEVERAADIVERHGPVDIDEQGGAALQAEDGKQRYSTLPRQQDLQAAQTQGSMQSAQGATQGTVQGEAQAGSMQRAQSDAGATAIPVIQEELKVGKREVQRGGVRIFRRVVETPVSESIGLREEHVSVDRRPADRPLNPGDAAAFQETSFELRETAEEAVVEKSARVVEEVVVGKEVTQREQQIQDSVRHTEVEVEQLSAGSASDDDAYFRQHWNSNYASSGGNYDTYAPAYRYGTTMAGEQQYRGRAWDDVAPALQQDWESRNSGSTWEQMKAAVRHGWERITS
ncbi:MAG TPA: YsnF/AvaK domain-containing protein [Janthinobacterium sp.]|nr:YsnF/AvaK domain-containing protein [Janthinobacterium sp.]